MTNGISTRGSKMLVGVQWFRRKLR